MATKKYEDIGVSVCVIDTALVQRQASVATRSLLSPEQKQTNLKGTVRFITFLHTCAQTHK